MIMKENKINIAELLKDCPKGMELDCTMSDNVTLGSIMDGNCYPIQIQTPEGNMLLSKYGCMSLSTHSKCVIFPKGKTTWEGFVPPCEFKDGDVIISDYGNIHLLCTKDSSYCSYRPRRENKLDITMTTCITVVRLATEEEKQKLFDAIKSNGYKWNEETKTLEKLVVPKFKVDDKIKLKGGDEFGIITEVADCFYTIKCKNNTHCWPIKKQDDWELVPNKFDISNLKPFDKVLVRCGNNGLWDPQFFAKYRPHSKFPFICLCYNKYSQCIPYEGNEHLLGTTDDCNEYFKTRE